MGFPSITGGFAGIQSIVNATHGTTYDNYAGATMLFAQASAPTGWTKDTTNTDCGVRVTSGTASTGGSVNFTTAMTTSYVTASGTLTGSSITVGAADLTRAQLPNHSHTYNGYYSGTSAFYPAPSTGAFIVTNFPGSVSTPNTQVVGNGNPVYTGSATGPWPHSHPSPGPSLLTFTGTSINMNVRYVDFLVATKD